MPVATPPRRLAAACRRKREGRRPTPGMLEPRAHGPVPQPAGASAVACDLLQLQASRRSPGGRRGPRWPCRAACASISRACRGCYSCSTHQQPQALRRAVAQQQHEPAGGRLGSRTRRRRWSACAREPARRASPRTCPASGARRPRGRRRACAAPARSVQFSRRSRDLPCVPGHPPISCRLRQGPRQSP